MREQPIAHSLQVTRMNGGSADKSLDGSKHSKLADPRLSQREAAAWLAVSVSTLTRWKSLGCGPASFKVGGRTQYRLSALEAFLAACERDAS